MVTSNLRCSSGLGVGTTIIYINDICNQPWSSITILNLYADDMTLYKPITRAQDFLDFQDDIFLVVDFVTSVLLKLNSLPRQSICTCSAKQTMQFSMFLQ